MSIRYRVAVFVGMPEARGAASDLRLLDKQSEAVQELCKAVQELGSFQTPKAMTLKPSTLVVKRSLS